ncbi:hypothetical protein [Cohnella soli]|uniref:Uncharacterized protein n=1 Tax=Cohnella soli TaxID=425005 RepID=A0ABW0HN47_9BACL
MLIQLKQPYTGGTVVVMNVPTAEGLEQAVSIETFELITQYVHFLDDNQILGDVEVTFAEIQTKFSSSLERDSAASGGSSYS